MFPYCFTVHVGVDLPLMIRHIGGGIWDIT